MKFVARVLLFPVVLLSAFLVLMLKWTLNLSAFAPAVAAASAVAGCVADPRI